MAQENEEKPKYRYPTVVGTEIISPPVYSFLDVDCPICDMPIDERVLINIATVEVECPYCGATLKLLLDWVEEEE